MVAMGFGDGGRYGEGSLVVAGEYRSNYVTTGEPSDPEAQLILFMDASALKTFQRERSWQSKGEPAQGSVIRLGWQEGDVQLNLPLGGRKFTRVSR